MISNSESIKLALSLVAKLSHNQVSPSEFVETIEENWMNWTDEGKYRALSESVEIIKEAEPLACVGAMLMDLHDYALAALALEHSLDIDAYDIATWIDLVRSLFELRLYDKAIESSDLALAVEPTNPLIHFMRGMIYLNKKHDPQEAESSLVAVRKYFEGKVDYEDELHETEEEMEIQKSLTYQMLGQCYKELEKIDESIECFEILQEREPQEPEFSVELCKLYLDKGDLPKSLECIDQAIDIDDRNTNYMALKVSILTDLRRYDDAIETLDEIIRLRPKTKHYILVKAQLCMNIHRNEMADREYRKLLSMKPKDEATRTILYNYFASIGDNNALKELDMYRGN